MAGKVNKGKNKGKTVNSEPVSSTESESALRGSSRTSSDPPAGTKASNDDTDGHEDLSSRPLSVDGGAADKVEDVSPAQTATKKEAEAGEVHLYPVTVKAQSGEKLELQLSPSDNVLDIRQFLLDASETCYFTCYDLILHTKDGSLHHMEDYNEVSEVADITTGGCYIEMVGALYDDRSIRFHVRRARELFSLSSLQTSLSTLLTLQHENSHQKSAELAKSESVELDGLGFMEDITSALPKLVTPTSPCKEIACVDSLVFSSFNPPPSYRRLAGDLMYLDVVTLEGNKFCITGTTKGFYINSSTGNILDPKPAKVSHEASTLVGVLQKISSKFKKGFREILDHKASAHPYENVQSLLPPPNSWLGAYPVPAHKRDAARAEDAIALTYGSELSVMQRDWNEELQSCWEFPHKTFQERILRDRALYKVTCDFVDAASKGAIGVINRCIPPINPTDPECFHMYVYNNIFFSFAVDADLGHISKDQDLSLQLNLRHDSENGSNLSDNLAKTSSNALCETNDNSNPCTSASSDNAHHTASDVSAELQLTDTEQATYASANSDLKGTKAYQEADIPGLYNLAMAIIDFRGYRVVAQSIIPGILQGDKSDSLLYGSVDNGKKICWNETFHSKVVDAAKHLHLKEHSVIDGSGNVVKLAAPVECKGIIGGDNRLKEMEKEMGRKPTEDEIFLKTHQKKNKEWVSSYARETYAEAAEKSNICSKVTDETLGESELQDGASADVKDAPVEASKDSMEVKEHEMHGVPVAEIVFNPNVFTEFKLAGCEEEVAADEAIVKKIATYLLDIVLPKFIQDLCSLEISPMDGQSLTDALHANGINIRYLGKVAGMVKHISHSWDLCNTEIIVRSAKHILKDVLRETQDQDLSPAIAHFFNCLFGHVSPAGTRRNTNDMQSKTLKKAQQNKEFTHKSVKVPKRSSHGTSSKESHSAYMSLASDSLWCYIQEFTKFKYQFELEEDAKLRVKKVVVVRNLCQKVGIKIAARKYDLESTTPFQSSDILDLQPVTKHSIPSCSEARELMGAGKARLAEGQLNEAHTFFSEAFTVLQQVTGPIHQDVSNCCRYLAMILYHAGDMAGAIVHQHKELIINERCLGLDHPDTAHSYGNMALFYHGMNQTELALRHMSRTLLLLSLTSGSDHPDVASTFINVAMMYQEAGNMNAALRYLQEALKKNERLLGPEHIQTAVCYHAFALAYNCMGAYKLSVQQEKKTYDILAKQLGEDDPRTRDSENWMKTFQMREHEKQKGPAMDIASALKTIKAHPELWRAFQAAGVGSINASGSTANRSLNDATMIAEAILRGKGADERAPRATVGARKKAVTKGLPVHQNGSPAQGMSPLKQHLHTTSSGISSQSASADVHLDDGKVEASGSIPSDYSVGIKDANDLTVKDRVPVGLGTTLASLDSKKQKAKPKAAS